MTEADITPYTGALGDLDAQGHHVIIPRSTLLTRKLRSLLLMLNCSESNLS
jgi:hypothetical protein